MDQSKPTEHHDFFKDNPCRGSVVLNDCGHVEYLEVVVTAI